MEHVLFHYACAVFFLSLSCHLGGNRSQIVLSIAEKLSMTFPELYDPSADIEEETTDHPQISDSDQPKSELVEAYIRDA